MARPPRFDRPDAWHHVMQRGARRKLIFLCEGHYLVFLATLEETVQRFGLEVHAYSLMPTHYHLLVRTPRANLSRCLQHLNGTFTQRMNLRNGWDGPLFRGRFLSQHVSDERYLGHVFNYVHLNPHRAGLAHRLDEPCWTSLRSYLGKERPPPWLCTEFFSTRLGGPAGVASVLRALRTHRDRWPPEVDEQTGWLSAPAAPAPESTVESHPAGPVRVEELLEQVARIAGVTVADLRQGGRGPGANPGRRLAIWALSRAGLTHREIASTLGVSSAQSRKVLWSLRRPTTLAFRLWQCDLAAGKGKQETA